MTTPRGRWSVSQPNLRLEGVVVVSPRFDDELSGSERVQDPTIAEPLTLPSAPGFRAWSLESLESLDSPVGPPADDQQIHPAFGATAPVVTGRERETPTSLRLRLVRPL